MSLRLDSCLTTFTERFAVSAAMTRKAQHSIPGGYSRNSFNFGPHAVFVERGDGAYIDTVDGHRLLDLNNNYTVNVLGHNHPSITAALSQAIPSGISFGNPTPLESELARILIDRISSVEKVQFSCSATESCMTAIRVARAYTGRDVVAKLEGGYHGFSDNLHVSSHTNPGHDCGTDVAPKAVADSGGIPDASLGTVLVLPQNDLVSCIQLLRDRARSIACLIVELQSGAGGLVALEQAFVEGLRDITEELGIVLIFDETISLRAGYTGLQGVYGVTPDLTVMGKIIGGGLPLGALGGTSEVMEVLESGAVSVSGTHHGHRLALVAGIACMQALDQAAFNGLNAHAERVTTELNEWSRARGSGFSVYGKGFSHLAYGYMRSPGLQVRNHRDYWRNVDAERTQICSLELANRGFFPVHRGEISLSTAMTDADISSFIEAMQEIVEDLES